MTLDNTSIFFAREGNLLSHALNKLKSDKWWNISNKLDILTPTITSVVRIILKVWVTIRKVDLCIYCYSEMESVTLNFDELPVESFGVSLASCEFRTGEYCWCLRNSAVNSSWPPAGQDWSASLASEMKVSHHDVCGDFKDILEKNKTREVVPKVSTWTWS